MSITFLYVGISLPTTNINHTALYKHGEKIGAKLTTFDSQYNTGPKRVKNVQSREHDEVISRVFKAMGFSLQFFTFREKRYVNIWGKYRVTDLETKAKYVELIDIVIKRFRRKPEPPQSEMETVVFSDIKDTNHMLVKSGIVQLDTILLYKLDGEKYQEAQDNIENM